MTPKEEIEETIKRRETMTPTSVHVQSGLSSKESQPLREKL
jgi:hypothetical protein